MDFLTATKWIKFCTEIQSQATLRDIAVQISNQSIKWQQLKAFKDCLKYFRSDCYYYRLCHTNISWVYRDWFEKQKMSSERQFSGRKCLLDTKGEFPDGRKVTATQITACYSQVMQRKVTEHTTCTAAEDHTGSCQLRTKN